MRPYIDRKLDGGLQHCSPALPAGLPLTERIHQRPISIRRVSGLIGSTPSSAEYCLRVARRMSRTIRSDDNLAGPDFWLISTPRRLTSQKSSLPQTLEVRLSLKLGLLSR